MDHRSDVLFVTDGDNHLTNSRYSFSITEGDLQVDNVVKYRQTIHAIEIHLVITLLLSESDFIAHQSRAVHMRCRLI